MMFRLNILSTHKVLFDYVVHNCGTIMTNPIIVWIPLLKGWIPFESGSSQGVLPCHNQLWLAHWI